MGVLNLVGMGGSVAYPYNVTGFMATQSDSAGTVTLEWTDPATDFDKTAIIRKMGGYPESETDGVQVYAGTGTSVTDTTITAAGDYYYQAFPMGTNGGVSNNEANRISTPIGVTAPAAVTTFTATAYNAKVKLSWAFADPSVVKGVKITATNNPSAEAVYVNENNEITGLTNGVEHTFYCWAENGFGILSAAALSASATPQESVYLFSPNDYHAALTGGWTTASPATVQILANGNMQFSRNNGSGDVRMVNYIDVTPYSTARWTIAATNTTSNAFQRQLQGGSVVSMQLFNAAGEWNVDISALTGMCRFCLATGSGTGVWQTSYLELIP